MEDTPQLQGPEAEILEKWKVEQLALKEKMVLKNDVSWTLETGKANTLKYVAGVDISFVKDSQDACAALVVCQYPRYEVVYEAYQPVQMTLPYIPGFLAFREIPFIIELLDDLKARQPQFMPELIIVDGNGILHTRGFGLACHLGVLTGIPTFGCGKTLFATDGLNLKSIKQNFKQQVTQPGDYLKLIGKSGKCHGVAYKSTNLTTNPVFLSPGHRIDFELMVEVAKTCCLVRVPEPVRQADLRSRSWIDHNYPSSSSEAPK